MSRSRTFPLDEWPLAPENEKEGNEMMIEHWERVSLINLISDSLLFRLIFSLQSRRNYRGTCQSLNCSTSIRPSDDNEFTNFVAFLSPLRSRD